MSDTITTAKAIQAALNQWDGSLGRTPLTVDGNLGQLSQVAISRFTAASQAATAKSNVQIWPYAVAVDGDDLIITTPVTITTFGDDGTGSVLDPQDSGDCADPTKNTKKMVLFGVALAMDSRQFPGMQQRDPEGYAALLGAPFPKITWGTPVEVTINGVKIIPQDGVIDLGPGHGASKPGQPHGCDLTIPAAKLFQSGWDSRKIADDFEMTGTVRVIGAAKFLQA